MKRAKRASRPIPAKYLFAGTLLAACTSYFIYVFRINAVYIDNTVFHGFSAMLFGGNILTAAILFSLFLLQAYRVQKTVYPCTRKSRFRCLQKSDFFLWASFFCMLLSQ